MLAFVEYPMRTRICDVNEMTALIPQWHKLSELAAEPNAYYAPHFALAALKHIEKRNVQFLTLWQNTQLVGLMPYVVGSAIPGLSTAGQAWRTDYTYNCTPLIDCDSVDEVAQALVTALATVKRGEWLIPDLRIDGPVGTTLRKAMTERNVPHYLLDTYARASLSPGEDFETHCKKHLSSSLRKNLTKRRRKLEEQAKVEYRVAEKGPELSAAIEAFLELEKQGWKGTRGTAMACKTDSANFARALFSEGADVCRADMLLADGKTIAIVLTVKSGDTGFTIKNAYDEKLASLSAGLLLEVDILKSFLAKPWAACLDASTNGAHVIDGFWPGRMQMGDLAFSLATTAASSRASLYHARAKAEAAIKDHLKRLLGR